MKPKETKYVVVTKMPLTVKMEDAYACSSNDKILVNSICEYRKQIEREGKEVFARHDNVIVCEDGYYFAFYEDDLRNMEGGIDNPIPFKGKDGRMKVDVIKENGEHSDEDLATLVAMSFCPNPKKYKRVFFRDANAENCNAENLFWSSEFKYFFLKLFKIRTSPDWSESKNGLETMEGRRYKPLK